MWKTLAIGLLIFSGGYRLACAESDYPNELPGFKFFGEGKLVTLKMGVSTRNDVAKIFGGYCEKFCDYDTDWKIEFWYFDQKAYRESYSSGKYGEIFDYKYFVPAEGRMWTIRSITLMPKKSFPFLHVTFPKVFEKMSQAASGKWSDGETESVAYDEYRDDKGLTYAFWNDQRHKQIDYLGLVMKNGDLASVEYVIPDEVEKSMFVQTTKQ